MKTRGPARAMFRSEVAEPGRPTRRQWDAEPDPARRRAAASEAMRAIARQRARRALRRLSLTESQARRVRRLLRDDRRQLAAAEEVLDECRHELGRALAAPEPDSTQLLELTVQERLLEKRERELTARLEDSLAALLRPDQALRLRALAPEALGDVLGRLCG
jgi:hypothetical protein